MNKLVKVGLAVLAVSIVALIIYNAMQPSWIREADTSYVYGKVPPSADSADGTFKFIGKFATLDLVEKAASAGGYTTYTWHPLGLNASSPYDGLAYASKAINLVKKTGTPEASGRLA
jgi:hypothetical protein